MRCPTLVRRVRQVGAEDFARRIGISRATLHRLERGDPGIALNTLAMALHAIGRLEALGNIAEPANDHVTMMQMKEQAPKRINKPRAARVTSFKTDEPAALDREAAASKFVGF